MAILVKAMPDNRDLLEFVKLHRVSQEKYTYFLLAAAGAAIAFAVQKTEGLVVSWWLLPVALATLCWLLSFYFGCKSLIRVQIALQANINLLRLRSVQPNQPAQPQEADAATSDTQKALVCNILKATSYADWQFRALIVGAFFFIAWRVAEMVRLTFAT